MIFRGLIFIATLALLGAFAAWVADNPGSVTVLWRGYRIDTSIGVMLVAVGLVTAAAAILYRLWGALWSWPGRIRRIGRERRGQRGYQALARGMVAVAAGETAEARRQARRADELLDGAPLTMLLTAQAAQLDGDQARARAHFTAMLEQPETEFLGLRGLLTIAEREGDAANALKLARRAYELKPKTPWVLTTLLDLQVRAGLWAEAEKTLRAAIRHKTIAAADGARKTAALLLQQSLEAEAADDVGRALSLARKARAAAAGFLPVPIALARLLHRDDSNGRAQRVIEDAWPRHPHPELARLYAAAAPARDALRAVKAMEKLAALNPEHRESHLALARAALDARLWGEARRHVGAAGGPASARLCRLMAELVESESGDTEGARQWLARATEAEPDPAWVCGACGAVAGEWQAVCGNCGAFDRLDWRPPPVVRALLGPAEAAELALPPAPAPAPAPAPGRAATAAHTHPDGETARPDGGEAAPDRHLQAEAASATVIPPLPEGTLTPAGERE